MNMNRSLRILVAHNVPKARTGGMSRVMGLIHDQLAQAGHVVDYCCAEDVSPQLKTRIVYPLTSLSQSRVGFLNANHIFCKSSEDREYLINWLNLAENKVTWVSTGANLLFAEVAQGRNYKRRENLLFAGTWIKR